jgi:hypothetical protein
VAQTQQAGKTATLRQRHPRQLSQAGGANHPLFMFRDALAAKKPAATRTERHGLAVGVIEAALAG